MESLTAYKDLRVIEMVPEWQRMRRKKENKESRSQFFKGGNLKPIVPSIQQMKDSLETELEWYFCKEKKVSSLFAAPLFSGKRYYTLLEK